MKTRRDFLAAAGKAGAAFTALAVLPTTAFAGEETLEQKCRRLLESVARLKSFTFERRGDFYCVDASWGSIETQTVGEFIGQIPAADTSTVIVYSLILPMELRGKRIPEQLYDAWGGKAKAILPTREYAFLSA